MATLEVHGGAVVVHEVMDAARAGVAPRSRERDPVLQLARHAADLRGRLGERTVSRDLRRALGPLYADLGVRGEPRLASDCAQLLCYGLWAARCSAGSSVSRDTLLQRLPDVLGSSALAAELLRRVVGLFAAADRRRWLAPLDRPLLDLPFDRDLLGGDYERFLSAYEPPQRRGFGVYLTPRPIVDFMLDRVEHLIAGELGLPGGLAEQLAAMGESARLLDPAAGTGAFLERALARAGRDAPALFRRLAGFEVLPVPYIVCHFRLRMTAAEAGVGERLGELGVFLADALESSPSRPGSDALSRLLSSEQQQAAELRESSSVAVSIANPPYRRGRSMGRASPARSRLVERYKAPLCGEPNVQPLADPYIAFFAAAERLIERRGDGVAALVTPSAFLSGRLYRGMRESLRACFDVLECIDLGGSARVRGVAARRGERDENVFEIAQGVTVSLMCRGASRAAIRHIALRGARRDKLARLADARALELASVACDRPYFLFQPASPTPAEYQRFVPLPALFAFHSVGGKPGDDATLVGFDPDRVLSQVQATRRRIEGLDPATLTEAQRKLAARPATELDAESVRPYAYRPFDERYCYDDPTLWTRPVPRLRRMIDGQPLLLTSRVVKDASYAHVFCAQRLPDVISLSATSSVNCHVFPMSAIEPGAAARALGFRPSARALFAYVYAVLHSPRYRARYLEGLRLDYPRVPLATERALFDGLSSLGQALIALHLQQAPPPRALVPRFVDGGDRRVRRVGESGRRLIAVGSEDGRLRINDHSYFEPIPLATWRMRIGGYQVCHKWLYDRQRAARSLSGTEAAHYCQVVGILSATAQVMAQIDELIAGRGGFTSLSHGDCRREALLDE